MNQQHRQAHRFNNAIQTALLLLAIATLLGLLGWLVIGVEGVLLALAFCLAVLFMSPMMSPRLLLNLYQARKIQPQHAPELLRILQLLSQRADLSNVPALYYIPSQMLNAFALGKRDAATIALTDGLLRSLNERELAAVLAHEISHVRHNDIWVMTLADLLSRMTFMLSQVGLLLLFISLPLALFGFMEISLLAILLLLIAPTVTTLLQLALSRTREYDADRSAVELTGDPQGLASALVRMERLQGGWLERIILPGKREPEPALLRSHPPTAERVRRILDLSPSSTPLDFRQEPQLSSTAWPVIRRPPRWHVHGLWH